MLGLAAAAWSCGAPPPQGPASELASEQQPAPRIVTTIEQLMPAAELARVRAALPRVAHPGLQRIFESPETLWYDEAVMTPSYQDSLGAQANSTWPNLVAASESIISGLHDRSKRRWQFPFSTTAGTDNSTNLHVVNFIHLPHVSGRPLSIPIWEVRRNYNRPQWMWVYPNGATLGEVLFIKNGQELLPSEVRIRTRHATGWSTNAFRPFPRATDLAAAVKQRRPGWADNASLRRLVQHLEDRTTLTPKTLAGRAALQSSFQQAGALDVLPDFGDQALVRELLTGTTFASAFGAVWKANGDVKTFAASTTASLSIVPNHYDAGVIAVDDDSCMRCHSEAGRLVSDYYDALYLYGELWGKDGIFSFHPWDESLYPQLRTGRENRRINPRLRQMGVFEPYDAARHIQPLYPPRPDPR